MEGSLLGAALGLVGVAFFVLLNAFFVAAEFGLVSVRPTRIEQLVEEGSRNASVVQRAIADPDNFIAATQLGITIASLSLGWIGEPALAGLLIPVLQFLPHADAGFCRHHLSPRGSRGAGT